MKGKEQTFKSFHKFFLLHFQIPSSGYAGRREGTGSHPVSTSVQAHQANSTGKILQGWKIVCLVCITLDYQRFKKTVSIRQTI